MKAAVKLTNITQPNQKATVHWLLFRDYTTAQNINDENAIKEFMFTLGDDPRIWYDDNQALFTDLAALEKHFKSTFGRATTREEHLNAFAELAYVQGEALNSYRNRVRSTAARARITDQRDADDSTGNSSVSFQNNRPKSPGPQSCQFCHKPGHDLGACFKLQRALREGHISEDLPFH